MVRRFYHLKQIKIIITINKITNNVYYLFFTGKQPRRSTLLEAIEKQSQIYEQREIDMFKDAVSIPGISVKWKFFDLKG